MNALNTASEFRSLKAKWLPKAGHAYGVEYRKQAELRLLDLDSGHVTTAPRSAGT